jgi:ribose 5-phosphate isomerase A
VTDNGNYILDVFNLNLDEPMAVDDAINILPGVVENGIFAKRSADNVLVARSTGVDIF